MGATGDLTECLEGADVFMGVSAPGIVDEDMLASTNDGPVLFGAKSTACPPMLPTWAWRFPVAASAALRFVSDYSKPSRNKN